MRRPRATSLPWAGHVDGAAHTSGGRRPSGRGSTSIMRSWSCRRRPVAAPAPHSSITTTLLSLKSKKLLIVSAAHTTRMQLLASPSGGAGTALKYRCNPALLEVNGIAMHVECPDHGIGAATRHRPSGGGRCGRRRRPTQAPATRPRPVRLRPVPMPCLESMESRVM
eukprot:gene15078-biopygen5819